MGVGTFIEIKSRGEKTESGIGLVSRDSTREIKLLKSDVKIHKKGILPNVGIRMDTEISSWRELFLN